MYYHLAYLTSMQSTACEMPGWVNHKHEPSLLGERPTTIKKSNLILANIQKPMYQVIIYERLIYGRWNVI